MTALGHSSPTPFPSFSCFYLKRLIIKSFNKTLRCTAEDSERLELKATNTDHTPTRSTESSASSPSDSESNSKLSAMEVTDGNYGVLAAGIAVAATMQLFVCTPETSHVGTTGPTLF